MEQAVPVIYARVGGAERLAWRMRLWAAGIALACLAPLLVAAVLSPNPDGTGSHEALGLARCQFLARTGIPCPSCGMTTSWTWFARGNLAASLYVQPMGTVLAFLAACGVWVGFYVAATGRPVYRLLRVLPGRYLFVPLLGFAIVAWAWKIYIHVHGIDGWK